MRVKRPGVYALICKKHMGAIYQNLMKLEKKHAKLGTHFLFILSIP
jgi:hypothetical protein